MALLPKSMSYKNLAFEFRKRFIGFAVPSQPHFDRPSIAYFKERLDAAEHYLEFGSGGSTVLAASSGKRGFSVDSDRYFLRDVRKKIRNCIHAMELFHADVGATGVWGRPKNVKPTEDNLRMWRNYIERPFAGIGENFYDLILIDGRWRVACALNTLREGAARGASFTILFDDYNRKHYHRIEAFAAVTSMVGRMAVIEVEAGAMRKVPTPDDVARLLRDVR